MFKKMCSSLVAVFLLIEALTCLEFWNKQVVLNVGVQDDDISISGFI